jgi:hypothetical protein
MGTITEDSIARHIQALSRHDRLVGTVARGNLQQLDIDSRTSLFVISILGEFKRGKSTLINALLGEDLLPRDVTPTTAAISIIRFSAEPTLKIHWTDGREETRLLKSDTLVEFTATADFDPDSVDYLEIGIKSEFLRDGIVIVDTPGVDDLNQHRSEVACRFVPRSDAVIFVLSATAPVRKSEMEFLDSSILEAGLDRILFVANFADAVDDELDQVIERISRRLAPALGSRMPKVLPFSATNALRASLTGDQAACSSSGLPELLSGIGELADFSSRESVRQRRFLHRLRISTSEFRADIEQALLLANQDVATLQAELATIDAAIAKKGERKQRLDSWLEDRRAEILAMVRKSLRHFQDEVSDHIIETVEDYKATDFKFFIEEKVPQRIKKFCKVWIEGHTGPMNTLLNQLDSRIIAALSEEFESHIPRLRTERSLKFDGSETLHLNTEDISTAPQRAGLLAGGAAAAMLLLHASVFVPIIGMAVLPFLMKGMTDQQLKVAKEKLRPSLEEALDLTLTGFADRIVATISADIDTLRMTAEERYDQLMSELRDRISSHLKDRTTSSEKSRDKAIDMKTAMQELSDLATQIEIELKALDQE